MTLPFQCILCKHYWGNGTCEAFQDQIPVEIWSGDNDHTEPYKGDNGIQFEPIEADNANRTPPDLD